MMVALIADGLLNLDLLLPLSVPCKSICTAADGGFQSAMSGPELRQSSKAAVDADAAGQGARERRARPKVDYTKLNGGV